MEKTEYSIETIQTPENVTLNFKIAEKGTRASAFLLDLLILSWGYLIPYFFILIFGNFIALMCFLLLYFLFHIFYFLYFEIKWQGVTPGKKAFNLKVIGRENVSLTLEAIVIRNLVRTIEFFIPYFVLFKMAVEIIHISQENNFAFELLPTFFWIIIFMLFPLFNPLNLRLGDILANTLVVELPKEKLLPDLVETNIIVEKTPIDNKEHMTLNEEEKPDITYNFKDEHLGYYGKYELQTLEEILRKSDSTQINEIKKAVADRIHKNLVKSGWEGEIGDYDEFLLAFYTSQRNKLEKDRIFGNKKADKLSNTENDKNEI